MALVGIEGIDPGKLTTHLWDKYKIIVVGIVHDEFKGIRVAPSTYTSVGEIDLFCEECLVGGRRLVRTRTSPSPPSKGESFIFVHKGAATGGMGNSRASPPLRGGAAPGLRGVSRMNNHSFVWFDFSAPGQGPGGRSGSVFQALSFLNSRNPLDW